MATIYLKNGAVPVTSDGRIIIGDCCCEDSESSESEVECPEIVIRMSVVVCGDTCGQSHNGVYGAKEDDATAANSNIVVTFSVGGSVVLRHVRRMRLNENVSPKTWEFYSADDQSFGAYTSDGCTSTLVYENGEFVATIRHPGELSFTGNWNVTYYCEDNPPTTKASLKLGVILNVDGGSNGLSSSVQDGQYACSQNAAPNASVSLTTQIQRVSAQ